MNFTMDRVPAGEREPSGRENQSEENPEWRRESEQTRDPGRQDFKSLLAIPARRRHAQHQRAYRGCQACAAVIVRSGNDFGLETERVSGGRYHQ